MEMSHGRGGLLLLWISLVLPFRSWASDGAMLVELAAQEEAAHTWHVFLSPHCSGALVRERWVMTSAACVLQWRLQRASDQISPSKGDESRMSRVNVRLWGRQADLRTPAEDVIPIREGLVYPGFDGSTLDGNVGVLYLARPPMLSKTYQHRYLALPDAVNVCTLRSVKLTGWGKGSGRENPHHVLHEETLVIKRPYSCAKTEGKITLRTNGNGRICTADYGSPLTQFRNGSRRLVGVFSRGKSCGLRQNTVFTSLGPAVMRWLSRVFRVKGKRMFAVHNVMLSMLFLSFCVAMSSWWWLWGRAGVSGRHGAVCFVFNICFCFTAKGVGVGERPACGKWVGGWPNEDTLWRQHCWRDNVSNMLTRFATRATFVADTNFVCRPQKHFLWPRGAQQCCCVLPRTGNKAGHNVAATMCPRFSGARVMGSRLVPAGAMHCGISRGQANVGNRAFVWEAMFFGR